jgi:D-alanyl-D-alanine carboxypeptidase/D-alanyl-D-alanine-endopeptidase (penicillin-binding protein 4)
MRCAERLALLVAWALAACATPPRPPPLLPPSLAEQLENLAGRHEHDGASVGLYVADAATGEPLYARREHARLLPASTLKLATTSHALAALGPEFRFRTPIVVEGAVRKGTLEGDLRVEASGDPSLGSWRWPETAPAATCDRIAAALAARGITAWKGALRLADADHGRAPLGPGWAWDDVGYDYSAPPARFSFRENVVSLSVKRTSQDCTRAPGVALDPPVATLSAQVRPEARSAGPALACRRDRGSSAVACSWKVSASGCPRESSTDVTVDDPLASLAACVDEALARARIQRRAPAEGTARAASEPEPLVTFESPPMSELVKATNKESLNLYAERLALELTRQARAAESYDDLRGVLAETALRRGLPARELAQVDGSGLSRYNLATPFALAEVVRAGITLPAFVDSLPVAGVDGTLARRTPSGEARGRVRAKTGSMTGHRSWAGVAERPGDPLHPRVVFALMLGNLADGSLGPAETFDLLAESLVTAQIR